MVVPVHGNHLGRPDNVRRKHVPHLASPAVCGFCHTSLPPPLSYPLDLAHDPRCCAATHNFGQLCAVRFFQGLIEASTYSGVQYIIGSWYRPHEIGKRTGLFAASVRRVRTGMWLSLPV